MKRAGIIFVFAFALFAFSCKHQQKTTSGDNTQSHDVHVGGEGDRQPGMTAGKATEEETFVQGCIQKSLGNNGRAMASFQECLEMNPKSAVANYEIAGLYSQMGQADRALKYAKAANDLSPDNRWYKLRYANVLQQNNQLAEATKILKELADAEPDNTDVLFSYALALKNSGKPDEALKVYDHIESLEGISDTLQTSRIVIYHNKNDIASEENALLALVKFFPLELKYQQELAEFYSRHGMHDKEIETEKMMAKNFPELSAPHLLLAATYQANDQYDKSFSEAATAFESPSGDIDAEVSYLHAFYPATDSSAQLSSKKMKEADSLCSILRRVHPDKSEAFSESGNYFYKEGKSKEAADMYRKAAELTTNDYAVFRRLLEMDKQQNNDAMLLKDSKKAQELFPTQPDAYIYLGKAQYEKKEYQKAIDLLESGLDFMQPDVKKEIEIETILVDCYRQIGKDARADAFSEKIIAIDSSNIPLIVAYCESQNAKKTNLHRIEQLMLYVVIKEPSNAGYYETLGWIFYNEGEYKPAEQWMSKALQLKPDNARMNEREGDIQYKMNNKDQALFYWKKAKEKGGSNPDLDKKISTKTMDE
jgi:tetratricopeptide (TPR) repeat protein